MNKADIRFYPEHPSPEKTHLIETQDSPLLKQDEPIAASALYSSFFNDFDAMLKTYVDTRFEISGVAIQVGADPHNKPSVRLSDENCERCYALCIFPSEDIYSKVQIGDKIVIKGNYLVMTNYFGVVLKKCELIL